MNLEETIRALYDAGVEFDIAFAIRAQQRILRGLQGLSNPIMLPCVERRLTCPFTSTPRQLLMVSTLPSAQT
jgi:hypothetical protein